MLMLSKKVEYGLMALLHMDASSSPRVISTKEIAELYDLPGDLLGKVMQAMARAELIEAEHGAKGGYRLRFTLEKISLGSVIDAIEGPSPLVRCQHDAEDCVHSTSCIVKEPLHLLHIRLKDFIHGISLDQLRRPEQEQIQVH